jgi:hypothetical protein
LGTRIERKQRSRRHAQNTAQQAGGNDPRQDTHEKNQN